MGPSTAVYGKSFFVKIFAICVADELGSALSVDPTDIEDSRDATVTFASSLPSIETLWSSKDKFQVAAKLGSSESRGLP